MNKITIIKALRNGEYEIREESECNCNIEWGIEECYGDYVLNPNIVSDQCWIGKVLYITDKNIEEQPIAQNIICYPMESLIKGVDINEIEEIFDNETNKIFSVEMGIDEDKDNEDHDNEMKETLLDFIKDNEYKCYIYYPRNFSNEYTCILAEENFNFNIDKLPTNAEELKPDEWVNQYLKKDDDTTRYYKGFKYYC